MRGRLPDHHHPTVYAEPLLNTGSVLGDSAGQRERALRRHRPSTVTQVVNIPLCPCPPGQERDANGVCVPVCPPGKRRDSNGICRPIVVCDPSLLGGLLSAIAAAIDLAAGFVTIAAAKNGSFFLAWMSPGWMLAAAAATSTAAWLCSVTLTALEVLCRCTGTRCVQECNGMRIALNATRIVLAVQASACLAAAAYAWIPWAALPSVLAIAVALAFQVAAILRLIHSFYILTSCARRSS